MSSSSSWSSLSAAARFWERTLDRFDDGFALSRERLLRLEEEEALDAVEAAARPRLVARELAFRGTPAAESSAAVSSSRRLPLATDRWERVLRAGERPDDPSASWLTV